LRRGSRKPSKDHSPGKRHWEKKNGCRKANLWSATREGFLRRARRGAKEVGFHRT